MRSSPTWIILAGLMLLLDFYVFQIIKSVSQSAGSKTRFVIFVSYWTVSILALVILFLLPFFENFPRSVRSVVFAVIIGLFLSKLIASVFFLVDDIRRGIQWLSGKLFFSNTEGEEIESAGMSRSLFLSWAGLAIGGGLFTSLIYGFSNKYNYKVKKVKLKYTNLPPSFRGIKIAQLSDIHSGSFTDKEAVERGVQKVLALKPDLILFTGDLVNNTADEMANYIDVFGQLKAPLGVYSVLGNHDYGDYVNWTDLHAKKKNLDHLKAVHQQMGWRLLLDEHVLLQKEQEQVALIGIQNWSALKRFPRYGNLSKAYQGAEEVPFKILMSHDPTHWDAEVRPKFPDIDLMLSGHTHGMQFGVEIPWLRWSPVQYVYKQWMGLYEEGRQKLYVNRGYGFIGYPGRVGILPEITLIELI
ncbi:MAG TPA: metallophosphoesterase [Flavisolibacter sp.]|nr:metallophosphoesterase [Flavisolibacter sp.]